MGKHVEAPCPFMFVSERAYMYHITQVHKFDFHWLVQWYKRKEDGGRLPRYRPKQEAGRYVVDRKVKNDPIQMIKLLKMYFTDEECAREL